jgi:hypothetical protein
VAALPEIASTPVEVLLLPDGLPPYALAATYGFMPESIESAFGHGHDMHH